MLCAVLTGHDVREHFKGICYALLLQLRTFNSKAGPGGHPKHPGAHHLWLSSHMHLLTTGS
jgi:hypothetical protein